MPGLIQTLSTTRNRTTKVTLLVCVASYIGLSVVSIMNGAAFDPLHYAAGLVALLFTGGAADALQTFAGRGQ